MSYAGNQDDSYLDAIGPWSEVKLEIIRKYAHAYSAIMTKKSFHHIYIDAFAGPGTSVSRATGELVKGSPLNALAVTPPFSEYHLIDIDGTKVERLRQAVGTRNDVHIYQGDSNEILVRQILPTVSYAAYRRALCLLDPYSLHLDWNVVELAGRLKTVDLFLNFPVMGINRTALWTDPRQVAPAQAARMTRFWGDESWKDAAYVQRPTLWGERRAEKLKGNEAIVQAFRQRLKNEAGFAYVPEPRPMKNHAGAIVYYLFFAAHQPVAEKIVLDILRKYEDGSRVDAKNRD